MSRTKTRDYQQVANDVHFRLKETMHGHNFVWKACEQVARIHDISTKTALCYFRMYYISPNRPKRSTKVYYDGYIHPSIRIPDKWIEIIQML